MVRGEGNVFEDERSNRAESDRLELELFPLNLDQTDVPESGAEPCQSAAMVN